MRLWHIQWGLPELYEEAYPLAISWKFWNWGHAGWDLNPHFFNYPALSFFLNFLVQLIHFGVGFVLGTYPTLAAYQHAYATDPTLFVVLARLLSVAFDIGTIAVLYSLGKELVNETAGHLAAFLAACCPLLVRQSQLINVDSPLAFFSTLSLLYLWRVHARPSMQWYLLAGLAIGLAAASKYNGALLLVVLVAAHFMRNSGGTEKPKGKALLPLVLAAATAAAVFLVCNPYILLDFSEFYRDFSFEEMHMGAGHLGADPNLASWQFYLVHALPGAVGWATIAAGVGALSYALMERKKSLLVVSVFPLLYLAMIGSWNMRADRYLLPVIPPLLLVAAVGVVTLGARLAPRVRAGSLLVCAALLVAQPLAGTAAYHRSFGLPDTRIQAKEWIMSQTPRGAVVASIPFGIEFPDSSRRIFPIPFLAVNTERIAPFYDVRWYDECDLVVGTSFDYDRYRVDPVRYAPFLAFYDSLRSRWQLAASFEPNETQPGPSIWLYRPAAHRNGEPFPPDLLRRLEAAPESSRESAFLQNLTLTALAKGNLVKGEQLLREIISVETMNMAARRTLAGVLLEEGKADDALAFARQSLSAAPSNASFQWLEGDILMREKRYAEAEPSLERAIALDRTLSAAYDDLLYIYVQQRDKAKALNVLTRHSAILPPGSEKARKVLTDINTLRKMP